MQVILLTGQAKPLAPGIDSAIDKQPVSEMLFCSHTGLEGDVQVASHFHGGPERALHYYPAEHYPVWRQWFDGMGLTDNSEQLVPGAFGENLSGTGLTEADACIGDVFRLGEALVQISQPRSPCHKLNARFGHDFFSVLVQANGRTGWLLRVLEEGRVTPTALLELVERPCAGMPVKRAGDIMFNRGYDADGLRELAATEQLSASWRKKAADYSAAGRVNDWTMRLLGPKAD
ncbi:MOSC domain-containing protein [Oceanimonas sp. CHS3-5]|uniref:MOSC domain-containing protein n=1 Tax=Oceanimonas sp. CHS3-5 TaxID=3068186 RepID=UPI00273D80A3|nr:MOSC domain-containing protein [Oceanimonas sp. CHS3-5]MDP5293594.1 MOSC domain-containing protein [Oceanimonas sp. CHS3-5]